MPTLLAALLLSAGVLPASTSCSRTPARPAAATTPAPLHPPSEGVQYDLATERADGAIRMRSYFRGAKLVHLELVTAAGHLVEAHAVERQISWTFWPGGALHEEKSRLTADADGWIGTQVTTWTLSPEGPVYRTRRLRKGSLRLEIVERAVGRTGQFEEVRRTEPSAQPDGELGPEEFR